MQQANSNNAAAASAAGNAVVPAQDQDPAFAWETVTLRCVSRCVYTTCHDQTRVLVYLLRPPSYFDT